MRNFANRQTRLMPAGEADVLNKGFKQPLELGRFDVDEAQLLLHHVLAHL